MLYVPWLTITVALVNRYSLQTYLGTVWGVAGFVALVAGMMWGARNGVQFALTFTALKALPVLILGGFNCRGDCRGLILLVPRKNWLKFIFRR